MRQVKVSFEADPNSIRAYWIHAHLMNCTKKYKPTKSAAIPAAMAASAIAALASAAAMPTDTPITNSTVRQSGRTANLGAPLGK